MKSAVGFLVGLTMLPYAGAFLPGPAGNPNRSPNPGESGSLYDSAANPPRTDAVVTYNPNAPLPPPPVANETAIANMPAAARAP